MPLSAQLARLLAKGISKAGRGTIPDTTMSPTRLQAQKITPNVPSAIASDVRTDVVDTPISVSDEFSAPVVKEVEPETSEELRAIGEELRVIRKKVEQTPAFYATMTTGELEEQVKLSKAKENEDMIIALGSQERVNRFNKLDRQMNSSNIKLSDEASEKFDIEFGDLTDEQDILIYGRKGVGPPTADEFKALFEARRVIEDLEDREYSPDSEVARVLIHGLLDFDLTPKKIRSLLIKKQGDMRTQEGSTYVLGAFQEAKNRGIDLEDELIRSMERRGFSEPEAYEMLNPFLTYTKEQRPQLKEFVSPVKEEMDKLVPSAGGRGGGKGGGDGIDEKREYAAEKMKQNPISGIGKGTQTASIGGASGKAEMRTSFLKDLPGARGEEAYRTSSPQAKKLKEKVKVGGWKPDPIMVWVNYDGKVYIAEGNHRVALAVERGEEFLPVDIRYFAGSEEVEGLFNPKTLEKNKALRLTEAEDPIKEEMDKLVPSAGGRGRGKGGGDGIDEDTAPLEEIEKFYKLPENQRQAQTPELKEAAQALQRKEITKQEFDEIADTFYPAKLITEMPEPPHARRIEAVLRTKVKSRPVVNETISKQLEIQSKEGKRFGTRLDIPAYNIYDTWVVTVHGPGRTGKALHYSKTAYLTDVIFMSDPDKALKVATGDTSKQSFARMEGQWKDMKPDDVYDLAAEELNKPNSEWVQIGMNPYKHSYFYDKKTMQPILSADEVIQVGPLVLARNVKRGKASDFVFNKGGVVDMRNGGRVRMKDGGELSPAYIRSFLSDIFTSTDEEIRDESYFDENEQNALLQVVKNSRKRHGENKGSIDYERDYPEGFKGIYYGGSSDLLTKNPFQSVKKTLGGFSWSYDPEKKEYFITDRYNFNDAEKIQKMYPNALNKAVAFAKEIGTRAATGQLGMYGIARTTGKYYGSEEGKGAQFLIRLSDKKKV